MATVSPLVTRPYSNKQGPDYHDLPLSNKRKRKIEHVRKLLGDSSWSPARVRHYALHGMRMHGSDVVEAFKDSQ